MNAQYAALKHEIDAAIQSVLESGMFIMGESVTKLEQALAEYAGAAHCISCANGTDALTLALMAWDIGAGDAVFVPDFTFFSTAEVVAFVGATPVFYDVDPRTFNGDAHSLETAIEMTVVEKKLAPKVIVTVDLFGQPSDYAGIIPIARKYGLRILEDAAQGFGGAVNGKRACSFGDISATSFFPTKPLGCYGDGGALFTDDEKTARKLRMLCVHGSNPNDKYDNRLIGMNSRLDAIQAAVLSEKLKAFQEYELAAVNRIAETYNRRLNGIVITPFVKDGFMSSWAQYTIKLPDKKSRDGLKEYLAAHGIPSMIFYSRGLHTQTAFSDLNYRDSDLPVSTQLSDTVLSLPMHPYLSEAEIQSVCQCIINFTRQI